MTNCSEESSPGVFALGECLVFDLHLEGVAASWCALGDVLLDLAEAALGGRRRALGGENRVADGVLVVEMRGAQTFEPRESRLRARPSA